MNKEVEKIVKGSRRWDGVLWRHQSHVATRRSHVRESNLAKQFHLVMHNMHKPCCTFDRRLECETRILLSLLSKLSVTVGTAYTGKTTSRLVCLIFFFWFMSIKSFSRRIFLCSEHVAHSAMTALCRTSDSTPSLSS